MELREHGEATIVEADVTYTRCDGQQVTVPVFAGLPALAAPPVS